MHTNSKTLCCPYLCIYLTHVLTTFYKKRIRAHTHKQSELCTKRTPKFKFANQELSLKLIYKAAMTYF